MNFVIIGTGFGALTHLPALLAIEGVQVLGLCNSGTKPKITLVDCDVPVFSDWREAIRIPNIDGVIIVVPPTLHVDIVQESLELGLHVLCEKPFGVNGHDARLMYEKQMRTKTVCALGFQFRFEPGILELRKRINAGEIGDIQSVNFSWLTSGRASPERLWSWQNDAVSGGGVINAFLSHVVDFLVWVTGAKCLSVLSKAQILIDERRDEMGTERQVTAEDEVEAQFLFANAIKANVIVSNCCTEGPGMEIMVDGKAGQLVYCVRPPFGPKDARLEMNSSGGIKNILPLVDSSSLESRFHSVFELNKCFVDAIRGGVTPNLPNFEDGARVQAILDAVRLSIKQSRVIKLSSI